LTDSKPPQDSQKRTSRLDSPGAVASTTGGITLVLNFVLPLVFDIPSENKVDLMTVTPAIAIGLTWLITSLWQAYGKDPQRVRNERQLKRAIERAKADLKDEHISDDEKIRIRLDYERYRALLREPDILGQHLSTETSNDG
jgi:hypothetical protein